MNILIIGLGSIARKHLTALRSLKMNAKIYALRSKPSSEVEDGVTNVYDLEDFNIPIHFAIISNPSNLHYHYIELLSKKDIPLFIEKPALHSLENSEKLVKLIEKKQLPTYIACNLRFHPCIAFLKKEIAIQSLRVNEVNVYCGSYLPDWRPGKDFRAIYSANASMGGGVHLDLFHEIDYITWIFGFPNKSTSILKNLSSLEIDAIDYANYLLEYDTFTANLTLNYYRRKPKRQIEILFDNDTWTVDLINNHIKNDNEEFIFQAQNFSVLDTYTSQLEYFISYLKNKKAPMNSFKESIDNLKICLN